MFGAPFSPKRAACGAQRRPRRCGRQICRFFFSRSPSSPCAADPSAASAAIVTDLRCRRGKIHDSSSKKCFDGFAGNFWYFSLFRRLLLFFVLCQRHALSVTFAAALSWRHALSVIAARCQLPQRGSHWHTAKLHLFASASPFGRGGCEADGEGKDAAGETLAQRQHRSDKEPAYRCAAALTQAACPLSHRCAMPALPKGEP